MAAERPVERAGDASGDDALTLLPPPGRLSLFFAWADKSYKSLLHTAKRDHWVESVCAYVVMMVVALILWGMAIDGLEGW